MKQRFKTLAVWSFVLALGIFIFSYILYHHTLPGGAFTLTWQPESGKPLITLLFAVWGVLFLFSGILSLLIAGIFFPEKKDQK